MRRAPLRINALSFATMMRCLIDAPHTIADLAEETGLHQRCVARYVAALKRQKIVRVAGWDPDALGRVSIAAYQVGSGEDARRRVQTRAESNARYRAKQQAREIMAALTA